MSMFTMKTESSTGCATSAVSPRATMIDTIAISNGTSPATTAPNTSRRTISAAGRPNWSSPVFRSCWESSLKSWSSVSSPVTATTNRGIAVSPLDDGEQVGRAVVLDEQRHDQRVPVLRDERRVVAVVPAVRTCHGVGGCGLLEERPAQRP